MYIFINMCTSAINSAIYEAEGDDLITSSIFGEFVLEKLSWHFQIQHHIRVLMQYTNEPNT